MRANLACRDAAENTAGTSHKGSIVPARKWVMNQSQQVLCHRVDEMMMRTQVAGQSLTSHTPHLLLAGNALHHRDLFWATNTTSSLMYYLRAVGFKICLLMYASIHVQKCIQRVISLTLFLNIYHAKPSQYAA